MACEVRHTLVNSNPKTNRNRLLFEHWGLSSPNNSYFLQNAIISLYNNSERKEKTQLQLLMEKV